jgi:hypothetical protein
MIQEITGDDIVKMHLAFKFSLQTCQAPFPVDYLGYAFESPKKRMESMHHDIAKNRSPRCDRIHVDRIPVSGDFSKIELIFQSKRAGA